MILIDYSDWLEENHLSISEEIDNFEDFYEVYSTTFEHQDDINKELFRQVMEIQVVIEEIISHIEIDGERR